MHEKASKWLQYCILNKCKSKGYALDIACGKGRNSLFLARYGYKVLAVDRNRESLNCFSNKNIIKLARDVEIIENWPIANFKFDVVIVTNFLNRKIFPFVIRSVRKKGYLIYETFSKGHEKIGKPKNKNFILNPYELILLCDKMKLICHETISTHSYLKKYIKQYIICKNV